MVNFVDNISINIKNQDQTATDFLDIEKAFDRRWRDGLVKKMHKMNLPLYLIKLVDSFLRNRNISVKVEDAISSSHNINASVPQGLCLAQRFTKYTQTTYSLTKNLHSRYLMTTLCFWPTTGMLDFPWLNSSVRMNFASDWFKKWCLQVNASKTTIVLFSKKWSRPLIQIWVNNTSIEWSKKLNIYMLLSDTI